MPEPLSLYIHIPFCASKCRYCDFYSVPFDAPSASSYTDALSKEIDRYREETALLQSTVSTVYVGGGTPSVLDASDLGALCGMIRERFACAPDVEWTVECNPDSFTKEKAVVFLDHGVTRLSFGMQSLDDRELSLLGRAHRSARCLELLHDPVLAGFDSIGVDLMYGLPGQTAISLSGTVAAVVASPYVRHISAYELTISPATPFGRHQSLLPLPAPEHIEEQTPELWNALESAGYEHYEISNFAKRGHRCRHNEAYWDHAPYLGIGCAAHSYIDAKRWANVKNLARYCAMVDEGSFPREFEERIDDTKLAMELVFLGLRRTRGIDEDVFARRCGIRLTDYVREEKLRAFEQQGLLVYAKPFWAPTKRGILLADGMARELV